MNDVIRIKDKFYILSTSSRIDDRTRVLKQGETFAVFDRFGDIQVVGTGEQGIYHEGTRFLSYLELRLGKNRPLLLSSTVKEENDLLTADLTNPDISSKGRQVFKRGTLHIFRSKFLWQGICYERLKLLNYGTSPIHIPLSIHFDSDFFDIFEVRGIKRKRRGRNLGRSVKDDMVIISYKGLDGVIRRTRIEFSPKPDRISSSSATFRINLKPRETSVIYMKISCCIGNVFSHGITYDHASMEAKKALDGISSGFCEVHTSNEQFNDWVNRSLADLHMMITDTPYGIYPYGGVPWFSTAFGRDGIITALECLWVNPEIARGVLSFLSSTQAKEVDNERDAEPGKILHEIRNGEMAALGEVPFGRYYGSVDATPLFVILAGAYYRRTGDREFIEAIWPNIELALRWIDEYGDVDGDGFVEYMRHTPEGLINQGWKDSHDSVFHRDGSLVEGPVALCEVQGYVYAAKRLAGDLARMLGKYELAERLFSQADTLKRRFHEAFWCEELSTYALALDGRKRQCKVKTSNAGHALFAGIADRIHAERIAGTLLSEESFSGWGVRTLADTEMRYNPMSYHNGSVWPHDNAIIAFGFSLYGFKEHALRLMDGLFEASMFMDLNRLPELFCGFVRRHGEGPTPYPVACSPQSWASGSVFMFLQASLGLSFRGGEPRVYFSYPALPSFVQEVYIKRLRVGKGNVDLLIRRYLKDVVVNVLRREGEVEIIVQK